MTVDLSWKKIECLELEKKNILIKLFDINDFLNAVKTENISLVEKVKELETNLCATREHLGMSSSSKLDKMLGTEKSSFHKTDLGYIESGSSSTNFSTKFVIFLLSLFLNS